MINGRERGIPMNMLSGRGTILIYYRIAGKFGGH